MEPSESNPFARAFRDPGPPGRIGRGARFALGLSLSLLLAASLTLALFLLGSLLVRGAGRGDLISLFAAIAVVAMTVVMARGRRRK